VPARNGAIPLDPGRVAAMLTSRAWTEGTFPEVPNGTIWRKTRR